MQKIYKDHEGSTLRRGQKFLGLDPNSEESDRGVVWVNPSDWLKGDDHLLKFGVTIEEVVDPNAAEREARELAADNHQQRLEAGVEWNGTNYPCLKKDRDGINGVVEGFALAGEIMNDWITANGPPDTQAKIDAMVETGGIPEQYRITEFEWSNGEFLQLNPADAKAIAGKISLLVSRSFIAKKAEIDAIV